MAIASVSTARLGIAVVETAASIVVSSIQDSIHALGGITSSRAADSVVAVASSGRDEDTVCLGTIQRDRRTNGTGQVIVSIGLGALETARWGLSEMVATAGLIVDDGDQTGSTRAEGILSRCVGNTAGRDRRNGRGSTIRATLDLVEGTTECAVQGTSSGVLVRSVSASCFLQDCIEISTQCSSSRQRAVHLLGRTRDQNTSSREHTLERKYVGIRNITSF